VTEAVCSVERVLREASLNKEHEKVAKIVHQLCHDFAYAVHQPYARNGGLIGLAAAAIALGTVRHRSAKHFMVADIECRKRLLAICPKSFLPS